MSNEFIRQNSERFAKMFKSVLEDNNSKSDKQASTEYTGVYTAIFPNKTPRELELEEIIKDLHYELAHLKIGDTNIPHLFGKSFEEIAKILSQYGKFKQSEARVKELERKLEIAKEALTSIEAQNGSCWCKFCKDNIRKSLQKMEEIDATDNKKLLQALQNLELELMDKLADVRQKIKELKEVQNDK